MKKLFSISWGKSVFFSIILVVVLALLLWRPILVLYHQQQAGKIIDQVATSIEGSDLISYRCFLGQLNETPPSEISIAINHLIKARELQIDGTYTAYLFGQAYCLNHEFEQAIDIFEEAYKFENNNSNFFIEEGFAYFSLLNLDLFLSSNQDDQINYEYYIKAMKAFTKGKVGFEQLITSANEFFDSRKINAALSLYLPLSVSQTLSIHDEFRLFLLSEIISPLAKAPTSNFGLPVLLVSEELSIQPEQMFVLDKAEKILINDVEENPVAVILSQKSDAVMLVEFIHDGYYNFDITALDRAPPPTKLQFSIDFQPRGEIVLPNGNDELVLNSIQTWLTKGIHMVSIKLLNDLFTEEFDRNGYIYQLKIIKIFN